MRSKPVLRLILALCLVSAFFALPALAYAAEPCEVTGTVTAAGTGEKLAGIRISGYYRINNSAWGFGSETTDENGEYSIQFYPSEDAYFGIHSIDQTGTYDGQTSADATIAPGQTKRIDFVMAKDAVAPRPELYTDDDRMYLSLSMLGRSSAALPDDVGRWAVVSSKPDEVWLDAHDDAYVNGRNWSYSNGSGLAKIEYAIDGGPWVTETPETAHDVSWWDNIRPMWMDVQLGPLSEGLHSVSYRATDRLGNASVLKNGLAVVDSKPPVTTYGKSTPTTKRLKLIAKDSVMGVASTLVRSGSTGSFQPGTSFSVPSKGHRHVEFYSVDKIGNTEAINKLTISARATLSKPKPSTESIAHTKAFKVTGSVYGRSKARGYLRIYKLKNGSYRYVSRKAFTEGSSGKYGVSLRLPAGTYRFVATYGKYTATWANPPVRSARSAEVRVR